MSIKITFLVKTSLTIGLFFILSSCNSTNKNEIDPMKNEIYKDSIPDYSTFWKNLNSKNKEYIFKNNEKFKLLQASDVDISDLEFLLTNKDRINKFELYIQKDPTLEKLFTSSTFADSPITKEEALQEIGNPGSRFSSVQDYSEIHSNITALVVEHGYDLNSIGLQIYHAHSSSPMARRLRYLYGNERTPAFSIAELTNQKTVVIRIIYNNEWIEDKSLTCRSCSPSNRIRTIFDVGRPCPPICPGETDNWNNI